ncbi:MAG: tetratricopeptide repeat protein, partial [Planctomycetota bacterium]
AKGKKATADEWSELGKLAAGFRLKEEARRAYEKAVSLEPDHEAARKGLGQVYYGGRWVPEEEAMIRQGKVKVAGRWVDRDDAGDTRPRPSDAAAKRKVDEAKAMVKAMGPDYVRCGNCNGSGMSIWIPCHQCERSDKKGYCWFGDKYAICDRCKGSARLPGIKCSQCRGLGKYDPKKKRSPKGRYIPSGFRICPTCNGTGVEAYTKCLQCARCKYPGFCYFGDKYTICHKCFGGAKVPALPCARCQRSGLLRERR